MTLTIQLTKCALKGCDNKFVPSVKWQRFCCEAHAKHFRWLRRKARIATALRLLREHEEHGEAPHASTL